MLSKISVNMIPVLSQIPNLVKELQRVNPRFSFCEISPDNTQKFKECKVAIADPDLIGPHLYELKNAKWIQCTWAGVDKLVPFIKPEEKLPFEIVRYSGKHFGYIMSEYVVANIVNFERRMSQVWDNQKEGKWIEYEYRTIYDLNVGVMGLGNIGSRIAKTLNALGATTFGYGRRPKHELKDDISYLSKYYTGDGLPEFLGHCDYIINVLPSTKETVGLLKGRMLKNCKAGSAVFVNIGRGNIIPEEDLIRALDERWIGGAILDVFELEPLPKENRLWKMKQVLITPHVAGATRANDVAEEFKNNFQLYEAGSAKFPTAFSYEKGY